MGDVSSESGSELAPGTRMLLEAFAILTLLAFISLFLGSELTDRYFAWTINPPLTAAFLGASYAAGCALVLLSRQAGRWPSARPGYLTVLVFVLFTLVATLMHLANFHFDAPGAVARVAAWLWLAIYVVVPVAMVLMLLVQERGGTTADTAPGPGLGRPLQVALAIEGLVMLVTGLALFLAPATTAAAWPWALTPLTARAVGSWLIALGVGTGLALKEDDLDRLRVAAITYSLMAFLQLVAVARYPDQVQWSEPSAVIYIVMLVGVLATGARGLLARLRTPTNFAD